MIKKLQKHTTKKETKEKIPENKSGKTSEDPYEILGIKRTCTQKQLKKMFQHLT